MATDGMKSHRVWLMRADLSDTEHADVDAWVR
jgi:hypothetical protein